MEYDQLTGIFRWRESRGSVLAGDIAGNDRPDGYVQIKIDKRLHKAHRLAWLYVYGEWPQGDIDHRDGFCNAIGNLRLASCSQNMANRSLNKNNSCGLKGVHRRRHDGKYRAYINKDGARFHLGYFESAELAHAAYISKSTELFGEYARAA